MSPVNKNNKAQKAVFLFQLNLTIVKWKINTVRAMLDKGYAEDFPRAYPDLDITDPHITVEDLETYLTTQLLPLCDTLSKTTKGIIIVQQIKRIGYHLRDRGNLRGDSTNNVCIIPMAMEYPDTIRRLLYYEILIMSLNAYKEQDCEEIIKGGHTTTRPCIIQFTNLKRMMDSRKTNTEITDIGFNLIKAQLSLMKFNEHVTLNVLSLKPDLLKTLLYSLSLSRWQPITVKELKVTFNKCEKLLKTIKHTYPEHLVIDLV